MKVKVWYDKEEERFFSEKHKEEIKAELKEDMNADPFHYSEVCDILGEMSIGELWGYLSDEGKAKILEKATEDYFQNEDFFAEGEIEI